MNWTEDEEIKQIFSQTEVQFQDDFVEQVQSKLPLQASMIKSSMVLFASLGSLALLGFYAEPIATQLVESAIWSVEFCQTSFAQSKGFLRF